MSEAILIRLAGILVLGILAQWAASRVRLPSILFLLATGIVAGPVTGWLDPDELFGDLMLPLVSLSVAVILYEGGLNLKFRELRAVGGVFFLLVTVGVLITWTIGAVAARYLLGFEWSVAALLGAILVVTGPTVIGPILRHLRLRGKVGALLKWEGIIIDPIGAALGVLVFSVVRAGADSEGLNVAVGNLGLTILVGAAVGAAAAGFLIAVLSRFWAPDSLYNPLSLMFMFVALTTANHFQDEAGLLAVTVMGIVLANQKLVSIRHVVEFKETLTVLLISCLFIILSARLNVDRLRGLGWSSAAFVAVMIVVARPISVLASTWRSSLTWRERAFLCCMAPRGIVAAAIASVFALSLIEHGYSSAVEMVPITFLMVFVTVLFYGAIAAPLARRLNLTQTNPQGILFIGADAWVRALAEVIHKEGCPVVLVDTDWENICLCRMAGLPCLYGSGLAEATREQIDYTGLGRMLAVTSNNEVNSLACLRYAEDFGRQEVYQLPFASTKEGLHEVVSLEHRGRLLFNEDLNFGELSELMRLDFKAKKTKLTKEFDYARFRAEYGDDGLPLFVVKPDRTVQVATVGTPPEPKPGDTIISLSRAATFKTPPEATDKPLSLPADETGAA
jgi:NhaP-type Na+/H+ or K+/H+ antiporter